MILTGRVAPGLPVRLCLFGDLCILLLARRRARVRRGVARRGSPAPPAGRARLLGVIVLVALDLPRAGGIRWFSPDRRQRNSTIRFAGRTNGPRCFARPIERRLRTCRRRCEIARPGRQQLAQLRLDGALRRGHPLEIRPADDGFAALALEQFGHTVMMARDVCVDRGRFVQQVQVALERVARRRRIRRSPNQSLSLLESEETISREDWNVIALGQLRRQEYRVLGAARPRRCAAKPETFARAPDDAVPCLIFHR